MSIPSRPDPGFRIAIAGAGIAGLTAALTLARAGFDIRIVERRGALSEIGAGLQLSPNAGRILEGLGLGPMLDDVATKPRAIEMRSAASGGPIVSLPLDRAAERYGAPYRLIHRADLQAILLDTVRRQSGIELILGAAIGGIDGEGGHVRFTVDGRAYDADLLIGADGVRSNVRQHLGGAAARLSGRTAWRATIDMASLPAGIARDATTVLLGTRSHIVLYPIRRGSLANIVVIVEEDWDGEGWSAPGDGAALRHRFEGQSGLVRDLIGEAPSWTRWGLAEIDPDGPWSGAGIALIGDAAHAMLPFLAQGAAMAIEDSAVLATELARPGMTVSSALASYEAARRPRVGRVWNAARQSGTIYHLGGLAGHARDVAMRTIGGDGLLRRYDWIYGWTPPD